MKNPLYDARPSKANAEARAKRKQLEKENPHFNMNEFGMKAGAIALLTAAAFFPWEKEYEKHERKHHPERSEDRGQGNRKGQGNGHGKDEGGRGMDGRRGSGEGRRKRRQSEGGDRERECRKYLDRDREYRALDEVDAAPSTVGRVSSVGSRGVEEKRYTGSDDGDYGRRYIEASRRESERMDKERGRRGNMDYEYRRSSRDDRRL